jgi:hypothetical protein
MGVRRKRACEYVAPIICRLRKFQTQTHLPGCIFSRDSNNQPRQSNMPAKHDGVAPCCGGSASSARMPRHARRNGGWTAGGTPGPRHARGRTAPAPSLLPSACLRFWTCDNRRMTAWHARRSMWWSQNMQLTDHESSHHGSCQTNKEHADRRAWGVHLLHDAASCSRAQHHLLY